MRGTYLCPIELPANLIDRLVPDPLQQLLEISESRREAFQDRRESASLEQFVASDHRLVYQTLAWIEQAQLATGRRFIEWGCGFAVNSCLAASLGWDVIAVDVEPELILQASQIVEIWHQPVELHCGNFLPRGAESLADDPYLLALGHPAEPIYETAGLDLEDFDVVFVYPWPGERHFIERVFMRFAAHGALLVCYRGPYEITVHQKRRQRGANVGAVRK